MVTESWTRTLAGTRSRGRHTGNHACTLWWPWAITRAQPPCLTHLAAAGAPRAVLRASSQPEVATLTASERRVLDDLLLSEFTLPDTCGHARLRAWGALAWSCAPAALTDCFGKTVALHHPAKLQGVDEDVSSAPWPEEILHLGVASSPKVRAAIINALGDEPPDFVNFMKVTGDSASARQQRFYDLDTVQALHDLQSERREEARRNQLTAGTASGRVAHFDTWVEWAVGVRRLPFRWNWILADRLPTKQRLQEESILLNYTGYLSVRFASFGSLMAALDALKFFHVDYLGACPSMLDLCHRLARQLTMLDKLMMRLEPCRKQRDVLSPIPSLATLCEYWADRARAGPVDTCVTTQIEACLHKIAGAACFTSGLRVQSVCPGLEWFSSGDRSKFWSLYTLVQLESLRQWDQLSQQSRAFHSSTNGLATALRGPQDPAEEYVLIAPPKQKTIYSSKKSNEISRRRWPYEILDGPLNLPVACFQLFEKLDSWIPGWRSVSHKVPAIFEVKSIDHAELQRAIAGDVPVPPISPFSPGTVYSELRTAVLAALPEQMHNLKIGDHVYRKSCHVAWSEMFVTIGGVRRQLSEPERDRCLGRSTQWGSDHGSARDYDEASVSLVRAGASAAAKVSFTVITAIDGRGSDHSQHSAVAASQLSPKRRKQGDSDEPRDYADDTSTRDGRTSPPV